MGGRKHRDEAPGAAPGAAAGAAGGATAAGADGKGDLRQQMALKQRLDQRRAARSAVAAEAEDATAEAAVDDVTGEAADAEAKAAAALQTQIDHIKKELTSTDPLVRLRGIGATGHLSRAAAEPLLESVLDDTVPEVRLVAAAMALANHESARGIAILVEFVHGKAAHLRGRAAQALMGAKGSEEAGAALAAVALDHGEQMELRIVAMVSLSQVGTAHAVHAFRRLMRDKRESLDFRQASVSLLGEVPGGDELLGGLLHDADLLVRVAAANQLRLTDAGQEALRGVLGDAGAPEPMRLLALEALDAYLVDSGVIGGPIIDDVALVALDHDAPKGLRAAARKIAERAQKEQVVARREREQREREGR